MAVRHESDPGLPNLDRLRAAVEAGSVDTVIAAFCDMQGRLMGKRYPARRYLEEAASHGTHFCNYLLGTDIEMGVPSGYRLMSWDLGYGDWIAMPDWNTLRLLPWLEGSALLLCDVKDAGGEPVPVAPRSVLRAQIERAAALGYSFKIASELEFYVFRHTYEEAHRKGYHDLETYGWYNEDYHILQGTKGESLYRPLRLLMEEAGVPIECSKGEAGPGQHEVNIRYGEALEAADRHVVFKHGAKEIAMQHGLSLTFMAKPHPRWSGSSCHIHISLWDEGGARNLFHDGNRPDGMSEQMRWFLGGVQRLTPELAIFFAPTINSYKRYAVASWAPVNVLWGRDNRTVGLRVVGDGPSLRFETRIPGADTNPYLAYAALIGAGLYGLEHRVEPLPPFHGNAYQAAGAPAVPRAMWEAIERLERSEAARAIFGDTVVEHYLHMARVEQAAYDAVVTCWEMERYFERG